MLGDIVTMAAYAGAYAELGIACFDRGRQTHGGAWSPS